MAFHPSLALAARAICPSPDLFLRRPPGDREDSGKALQEGLEMWSPQEMAPLQGDPVPHGLQRPKEKWASPWSPWGTATARRTAPEHQLMVTGDSKKETHTDRQTDMLEHSPARLHRLRVSTPESKDWHTCTYHTDILRKAHSYVCMQTHTPPQLWNSQNG